MVRWALALSLAPIGFVLLLAQPEWDVHWEDHRAHFWLVFSVALVCALLGLVMSEAASRRGDARVFLVGLAFLVSSGFLGLHALATPGVLLDGKNTGFACWAVTVPVVVREYGGLIERFAGDAVMVIFNAGADQPDHAHRAVAATLAMQRAADAVAKERPNWPRFRAGVNTGRAIVGNVGTAEQRSFAAIGDTTNLASRLQTTAAPGQVVIGSATAEALGDRAVLEPLETFEVKGRDEPVEAFVVVRLDSRAPRRLRRARWPAAPQRPARSAPCAVRVPPRPAATSSNGPSAP